MKKNELLKIKKKLLLLSLLFAGISINNNEIKAKDTVIVKETDNEKSFGELVTYYSKVFGVKEEYIYDALDYNTDGYSNIEKNIELSILNTTRDIYYNPENYGYKKEKITIDNSYEMDMEIEEAIEKYANLYDINKEVALAIVYCECGSDVDSANYNENNNPAGLGPYTYFKNKEIGVIYFINFLKEDMYCSENSGESFLYSIANSYSGGNGDHWSSLTVPFYHNLCNDYYYKKPELKKKNKTLKKSEK